MKVQISERAIRDRASKQSFDRGYGYYRHAAISATIQRGYAIEGHCEGSYGASYHARASLSDTGHIEEAYCTCEYSYPGDCKHIVALLLTYCHEPELFDEVTPVQDKLAEHSNEELIALIQQMVDRYPDLAPLVDRPIPRPTAKGEEAAPVDVAAFQRELRQGLDNHHSGISAPYAVQSVAKIARDFANVGQWHNASAIYRTILEEVTSLRYFPDDEGDLIEDLNLVVEGILECLGQEEIKTDTSERDALVKRVADVYIWDFQIGYSNLGEGLFPEPLLQHLQSENIAYIRTRFETALRKMKKSSHGLDPWKIDAFERYQMQLDTLEQVDPEKSLQRLRAQGLHLVLVKKLLEMGRVDEAVDVILKEVTSSHIRYNAIMLLAEAGHRDRAIELAKSVLKANYDGHLANWLEQQYRAVDDREALCRLRLLVMEKQPSLDSYSRLKEAAEKINAWNRLRPKLLSTLEEQKAFGPLVKIYLAEEEWEAAWQAVEQNSIANQHERWRWPIEALELEVAEKTKALYPHKAIAVFINVARARIEGRSRSSYQAAIPFLSRARDIYLQHSEEDRWRTVIEGIRAEFSKLRALLDEIDRAGL